MLYFVYTLLYTQTHTHTLTVILAEDADVVHVKTMPSMGYKEYCMVIEEIFKVVKYCKKKKKKLL